MNIADIKYCPVHGTLLPCKDCNDQERDNSINYILAVTACERIKPDNPGRVAVSITALHDVLKASQKFVHDFDEFMIGVGKAKKEGLVYPTDMVHRVEKMISELIMYNTMARLKIGDTKKP